MKGLDGEVKYEDREKVIVFLNGSNHLADWIDSFFFRGKGGVHSKWLKMVQNAEWLMKVIDKANENQKKVMILGYSMGGACAEIYARNMVLLGQPAPKLYLFGAPKGLSRRNQNELYGNVSVFRFVNRGDVVPGLPLRWRQSKGCTRIYSPQGGHKYGSYQGNVEGILEDLKRVS